MVRAILILTLLASFAHAEDWFTVNQRTQECQPVSSPAAVLDACKFYGERCATDNDVVENGKVVQTTVYFFSRMSSATAYRTLERCQKDLARERALLEKYR